MAEGGSEQKLKALKQIFRSDFHEKYPQTFTRVELLALSLTRQLTMQVRSLANGCDVVLHATADIVTTIAVSIVMLPLLLPTSQSA